MKARLTYGSSRWRESETWPVKRAAQEAVLLSAILLADERPLHVFLVSEKAPLVQIAAADYFIKVELVEREKQLCNLNLRQ